MNRDAKNGFRVTVHVSRVTGNRPEEAHHHFNINSMKKTILILLACSLGLTANLLAQGFVTPLTSISGETLLTTTDGKEIPCEIKMAMFGPTGIMSLTVKDNATGEKVRYKAEQVAKLRVKIDGLAKLEMIADKTSNLKKMMNADFNEITERKYAYYEQVQIPGKDKYVLTQLLNPGFDNKIKVYDKPMAKTGETSVGGIAVSGGEARAYFILKDGVTLEITRGKYAREYFKQLFSGCPDLLKAYPEPEFADFAEHVLYYERLCK